MRRRATRWPRWILLPTAIITISLLLLALQQTAASLSTEVFDQFLRRRRALGRRET